MKRSVTIFAVLSLALGALTQEPDPANWPARDSHEGLLVAADPYRDAARSKETFGKKHPVDFGILPLEVVIRNDTDKPILVNLETIRLLLQLGGNERQQLEPMALEDVIERILYRHGPDASIPRRPLPSRKPKDKSKEYLELELRFQPHVFPMTLIPPKETVRGFFFFNMGRRMDRVDSARLYIPDVQFMHNKQPLFFFEVDLSKAVQ